MGCGGANRANAAASAVRRSIRQPCSSGKGLEDLHAARQLDAVRVEFMAVFGGDST
jgi:hypothetical protein